MPLPRSSRAKFALAALFAMAVLGNHYSVPLFLGVNFLFGSVATMVALRLFGGRWGLAVALAAGAATIPLGHHPYGAILFAAEALAVGLLVRWGKENLPLLDGIFWLVLGMPLAWFFYRSLLRADVPAAEVMVLKLAVNGIFNSLLATLLLTYSPLRLWAGRERAGAVSLYQTLFNFLVTLALAPALIWLVLDGQREMARVETDSRADLRAMSAGIDTRLATWKSRRFSAVTAAAEAAAHYGGAGAPNVQQSLRTIRATLPDFQRLYVTDAQGLTRSYEPQFTANGVSNMGLDFSDRPYFLDVRRTRRPVITGIYMGRGGVHAPIITVNVPIPSKGGFAGMASGTVLSTSLLTVLKGSVVEQDIRATLVDAAGHVIASTRHDLHPLAEFKPERSGDIHLLNGGYFQWVPRLGAAPPVARWKESYYGRTTAITQLPWKLMVEAPVAAPIEALQTRYIASLSWLLALSLSTLALAALLTDRVTKPLAVLARLTTDVPETVLSNAPTDWPKTQVAEVATLVANYRAMVNALQTQFQDLKAANEGLAEAHRQKDEFLAMLAHELRNPLGAASNAIHILRLKGTEQPGGQRAMDVLDRQITHQTRLVGDLLDVSRISRGKFELQREDVDLTELLRHATEDYRGAMEAKGVELATRLPRQSVWVWGDRTRLAQIFTNLLHNAQKFTPADGLVTLTMEAADGSAVITVKDTGAGIAPEVLPGIFDAFTQGNPSLDRALGGLGLGLAMVKGLAELHGGGVAAASEGTDRGSAFTIQLPLDRRRHDARNGNGKTHEGNGTHALRVLVIEDNADAAETLRDILELSGHTVQTADTGPAGLDAAGVFHPDVVLCDIGLPGMDGYQVAGALRRRPDTAATRLIAVSGYGQEEDLRRGKAAGFDEHLTKPVNITALQTLLAAPKTPVA